MRQATSIDEVIQILGEIIASEVEAASNMAFFPTLYKQVTERIKQGIQNQEFDDNARMERLDVIFANRYIAAYDAYKSGGTPTKSWETAFKAADNQKLLILQHLLLGINAHINLDLGIAVSETMRADEPLEPIHDDFNKINAILSDMADGVQKKIGRVSPLFSLLDKIMKGKEDLIASFSIEIARDEAWIFANEYHASANKEQSLQERDTVIASIGARIANIKSRFLRWVVKITRWFESKNVAKVVRILGGSEST